MGVTITENLLSVNEALAQILAAFQPVSTETIPLDQCAGRVLAEDIRASVDLPDFTNSSMDGFAVRAQDVERASLERPTWLEVVADIPAGSASDVTVQPGQAARIMTGAPLPDGADAVIPVENTDQGIEQSAQPPRQVAVYTPTRSGQYIRPRGQDIHSGQLLLQEGRVLQAQDVGLLAAIGLAQVKTHRQPRVALFSSGNELVEPGQPLKKGQIYDTNQTMLSAMVAQFGARVFRLGTAKDDPAEVYQVLHKSIDHQVDLIITSAGVSVGAYDYVRQVIETHGRLSLWRVNMRPGKPVAFGVFEGIPLIGLPGNPVSAYIGSRVFVLPVLQRLAGTEIAPQRRGYATINDPIESDGRESYLRAVVVEEGGKIMASLTGHQGSGNLNSLVQANALLIVPSGVKSLPSGSRVEIWYF